MFHIILCVQCLTNRQQQYSDMVSNTRKFLIFQKRYCYLSHAGDLVGEPFCLCACTKCIVRLPNFIHDQEHFKTNFANCTVEKLCVNFTLSLCECWTEWFRLKDEHWVFASIYFRGTSQNPSVKILAKRKNFVGSY
jgi:hypothetical protein